MSPCTIQLVTSGAVVYLAHQIAAYIYAEVYALTAGG